MTGAAFMQSDPGRRKLLPSMLGTLGIALWATETVLITFTTGIPPLQTVGLAFAFAALLSPAVWLVTGDDPRAAFRQPPKVWLVTVGSLVGYHACIYYATQKAPPAAAALLQGTTPLIIVLGSALLPGERLRWWHVVGTVLGFAGILLLIDGGGEATQMAGAGFYLGIVGAAAAVWGLYSIASRRLSDVPSSALGVFYAASAAVSLALHANLETWVMPDPGEWLAVAALGLLPMGLALFCWDFGVKHGDIQALGAISYVEPFIGAALVAAVGQGDLTLSLLIAGMLVVSGATVASFGLFFAAARRDRDGRQAVPATIADAWSSDATDGLWEIEGQLIDVSLRLAETATADTRNAIRRGVRSGSPEVQRLLARMLAAWDVLDAHRGRVVHRPAVRLDPDRVALDRAA